MHQPILYEFPLNERMRNFMRLENYFSQINYFAQNSSVWDSQTSLLVLIEILNIIERNDVRSELTKELERNIASLSVLADVPEINSIKLQQTLDELQTQLHTVQHVTGKITRSLREDDLLNAIKQRVAIASNINSFDIPSYYYWLNRTASLRQQQLRQWLKELEPIESGVKLLNSLLRDSSFFETKLAEAGFFQKSLNAQQSCQMVRVAVPGDATYFPEASGSKHRVSIRFLANESSNQRPCQIDEDVTFGISFCSI